MSRGRRPTRIGEVLGALLEQKGLQEGIRQMHALDLWAEVVGPHIAEVTAARDVAGGVLFVEVRTSAWLMELNFMKGELLERMNERLEGAALRGLVFVLAETQ